MLNVVWLILFRVWLLMELIALAVPLILLAPGAILVLQNNVKILMELPVYSQPPLVESILVRITQLAIRVMQI